MHAERVDLTVHSAWPTSENAIQTEGGMGGNQAQNHPPGAIYLEAGFPGALKMYASDRRKGGCTGLNDWPSQNTPYIYLQS